MNTKNCKLSKTCLAAYDVLGRYRDIHPGRGSAICAIQRLPGVGFTEQDADTAYLCNWDVLPKE